MKPKITWILIADGAHARILLNDGPGHGLKAVKHLVFSTAHPASGDIVTDRAGRSFDSIGSGRHAMESKTDPHDRNKQKFAMHVADILEVQLAQQAYDQLIIIAPPGLMGDFRGNLSKQVQDRVIGEIAKDLNHTPNDEIAPHLAEILAC